MTMEQCFSSSPAADAAIMSKEQKIPELLDIVRQTLLEKKFPLPVKTDSGFLVKFLRCKKYCPHATVEAIENYYHNIFINLRLVEGIRPSDFLPIYDMDVMRMLKHKKDGATVAYFSMANWDTKISSLQQLQLAYFFVAEEYFQDVSVQLSGFATISDLSGFSLAIAREFTPQALKFCIKLIIEMFPVKAGGFHFVNVPLIFWPIYKVGVKLLPKKLQSRVHIHKDIESLAKSLGQEILPKSLGGNLEEHDAWDEEIVPRVINQNPCYDSYWNGSVALHRSRRLTRKRSSQIIIANFTNYENIFEMLSCQIGDFETEINTYYESSGDTKLLHFSSSIQPKA